jgi:chorismate lyase
MACVLTGPCLHKPADQHTENHILYDQQPTRYQPQSPTWRDFNTISGDILSTQEQAWLLDQGSLTERLVKKSQNQFYVDVLRQAWANPDPSEAALLGQDPSHPCLIREVLLYCCQQPWVYAKTVMPESSLHDELAHLRDFDNQPLGQLLFNTPGLIRSPFEVAQYTADHLPKDVLNAISADQICQWGRRSRFVVYDKPLLVNEIFLPAFQP